MIVVLCVLLALFFIWLMVRGWVSVVHRVRSLRLRAVGGGVGLLLHRGTDVVIFTSPGDRSAKIRKQDLVAAFTARALGHEVHVIPLSDCKRMETQRCAVSRFGLEINNKTYPFDDHEMVQFLEIK